MKGSYLYINKRKKLQLTRTVVGFLIAAAIFVTGLILNKGQRGNVFTIVAALAVLPTAKFLVGFIILAPYKSVNQKEYEKATQIASPEDTLFTDVVFTSTDKVMNLSFLAVTENEVLGLAGREKENTQYMTEYLTKNLKMRGLANKVYITKNKDDFYHKLSRKKSDPSSEVSSDTGAEVQDKLQDATQPFTEKNKEINNYLLSLMV